MLLDPYLLFNETAVIMTAQSLEIVLKRRNLPELFERIKSEPAILLQRNHAVTMTPRENRFYSDCLHDALLSAVAHFINSWAHRAKKAHAYRLYPTSETVCFLPFYRTTVKTRSPAVVKIADRTGCQLPSRSSKVYDFHLI